ncbi:MAG: hypothetical protein K9I25_07365 [Crocinitomicaceae bacterium]|nr:hypothetical protein [Crocinitomicaceae bacterium]
MRSLVLSLYLVALNFVAAQELIELDTVTHTAHARALRCHSSFVYLGDNQGRCFSYNPITKELILINLVQPELRDVEVNKLGVLWMQTGDTGKVFLNAGIHPVLFPRPDGLGVFLDGIAVKDSLVFAMGDPINGEFSLYLSRDYGLTWKTIPGIKAEASEAAYAASGSTVQIADKRLIFVTGGLRSRIFIGKRFGKKWKSYALPFKSGEGEGPYSLCVIDRQHMVVVGGNYQLPNRRSSVCYITSNGGKTWKEAAEPPFGYRSDVIHVQGVTYACGSNGIDFSTDGGNTWVKWLTGSFISMDVSEDEKLWITTKSNLGLLVVEPVQIAVIIGD